MTANILCTAAPSWLLLGGATKLNRTPLLPKRDFSSSWALVVLRCLQSFIWGVRPQSSFYLPNPSLDRLVPSYLVMIRQKTYVNQFYIRSRRNIFHIMWETYIRIGWASMLHILNFAYGQAKNAIIILLTLLSTPLLYWHFGPRAIFVTVTSECTVWPQYYRYKSISKCTSYRNTITRMQLLCIQ